MLKRMIALFLVIAMLVPLSSAVAADATSAPPTVEEILSEYHRKAFEAQTQGETSTTSTWSRRGTEKTLEQETVDTLTEAGYEAYNVTADNYDTLEAELQTDFAGMGLNPEGSYIIVVHGEDATATNSNARTGGSDIEQDNGDLGGQDYFEYVYDGITYRMRYVTVYATPLNGQFITNDYSVTTQDYVQSGASIITDTAIVAAIDKMDSSALLGPGTILGLVIDWATDDNYIEIDPSKLHIEAESSWTCDVLQIWCSHHNCWEAMQYSEYVYSRSRSYYYEGYPTTLYPTAQYSEWHGCIFYSPKYKNYSERNETAVLHYLATFPNHDQPAEPDIVPSVRFYLVDKNIDVTDGVRGKSLFAHIRDFTLEDNIE